MKILTFLTLVICLQTINAAADSIQLSTYYPSPYGAYSRLRLVPQATLPNPCQAGMMYVNQEGQLQYCTSSNGTSSWGTIGTITGTEPKALRVERGSIEITKEDPATVTFDLPFTTLPFIQIYAEVVLQTKDGSRKSVVDFTSKVNILDVTPEGCKIAYLGEEKLKLSWLAAGN